MKKVIGSIAALLMLVGTQAVAAPYNAFIDHDDLSFSVHGALNQAQDSDIWAAVYGGYSYGGAGYNFTGYYLGTFSGNDSESEVAGLINYYLGTDTYFDYTKVDAPGDSNGTLTITYDGAKGDSTSGTWATESPDVVSFYTIKASNQFALYFLDPSADSGVWTTAHLRARGGTIPGMSHITVATTTGSTPGPTPGPTPVPEPATMLLFGAGLAGLAGMGRRRLLQA